jgi:N4-gp56 family major capsid protein
MALDPNATMLTNLVNPQVMADMIDKKLVDFMRFAPLATIDTTLEGRAGSQISLPSYSYIGDAAIVAEGADIGINQLTASPTPVTIFKVGNGVQITDEAVLSGYGDPMGEAAKQLALSIASEVDNLTLNVLSGITSPMVHTAATAGTLAFNDIADALELFGEDIDEGGVKVLLISPKQYTTLRKSAAWLPASDVAADIAIKGVVGMVQGCQVVISNKLTEASNKENAYIVKPGALRIFTKRNTLVESDRDIINKSTVVTADKHFAPYLYDASKAIKIVVK